MICIIGNRGNMGLRYAAVLRYLGYDFTGVDIGEEIPEHERYIVCTPTDTHYEVIKTIPTTKRILCEKPITKDITELNALLSLYPGLTMVNNWQFVTGMYRKKVDHIVYNYYNTGRDGFYWDLIQPLYITSCLTAANILPALLCKIDDYLYTQRNFDFSYVEMIRRWVKGIGYETILDHGEIMGAHKKALIYQTELEKSCQTK